MTNDFLTDHAVKQYNRLADYVIENKLYLDQPENNSHVDNVIARIEELEQEIRQWESAQLVPKT